ncbi:FAD-binding protein [Chloroflexota bacterium]
MAKLDDLGEVISTDVLIIGGGFAGLIAAIRAKEQFPGVDVLIVEKQTTGWSGKAPKINGLYFVLAPGQDLDKLIEYHVRNMGLYLNDQDMLYQYLPESLGMAEQLTTWGAKFARDTQGKLVMRERLGGLCSSLGLDINVLLPLRAKARKMGTKILDKVHVVELLKQDDRVVGAVGFNIIDGRFYIFKAKATILANGGCGYNFRRMWASGSGDGIDAAYRAGAEMRNAEFGNSYVHIIFRDTDESIKPREGGAYERIYNALGESLSQRYAMGPQVHIGAAMVMGFEKEVREGRGPIYFDNSQKPPPQLYDLLPKVVEWKRRLAAKVFKYAPHDTRLASWPALSDVSYASAKRLEVTVYLHAELTPVKVDHNMKTTLTSLWALGDCSYVGSAALGAYPAPHGGLAGGIPYAAWGAFRAGLTAATFAGKAAEPKVDGAEVERLKEDIFAPIRRENGLLPVDVIYTVQNVICPIKYNLRRSKDRLEEALSQLKAVQDRLPDLWAKDTHYLSKCHEAKSMTICAEMTLRSALMRTESRGWHFREDYPERDDKNWLKWVIAKQKDGKMVVSTEPIPIGKYKFKPS